MHPGQHQGLRCARSLMLFHRHRSKHCCVLPLLYSNNPLSNFHQQTSIQPCRTSASCSTPAATLCQ